MTAMVVVAMVVETVVVAMVMGGGGGWNDLYTHIYVTCLILSSPPLHLPSFLFSFLPSFLPSAVLPFFRVYFFTLCLPRLLPSLAYTERVVDGSCGQPTIHYGKRHLQGSRHNAGLPRPLSLPSFQRGRRCCSSRTATSSKDLLNERR